MTAQTAPEAPDNTPPPQSKRWKKILLACLLTPMIVLAVALLMIQTQRGTIWLCEAVKVLSAGMVKVDWRSGNLARGGSASLVAIHLKHVDVDISNLSGEWRWDYVPLKWSVSRLSAQDVVVTMIPKPNAGQPVGDITMPFAIAADRVQVESVRIINGTASMTIMSQLAGAVASDKRHHMIDLTSMTQGTAQYSGKAKIDGVRPYAIDSDVQAVSDFEGSQYRLDLSAKGDLRHLTLGLAASGGTPEQPLTGKGTLEVQLLEHYYIHQGQVDISRINPYIFWNKLLKADLDVTLGATPQVDEGNTEQRKPVNGAWQIINHAPAPLSDFSLPVTQASGGFALSSDTQKFNNIEVLALNKGRISGSGEWAKDKGLFLLNVVGFDLKNIHPKLLSTQLEGTLNIDASKNEQHFFARLQNKGDKRLALLGDVVVDRTQVTIKQARVAGAGDAQIDLQGELLYSKGFPFSGKARLLQFNLAELGDFPSSHLVGHFDVDGVSLPNAKINIKGNLNDSVWAGVAARGIVDVGFEAPDTVTARVLDVTIGANHIDAKGALGSGTFRQDKLNVNINAPNLAQLQFGFGGSLVGRADLTGALTKPRGRVDLTASDLKLGVQSVRSAKINGVWEVGAQGAVNGQVDVTDYSNGAVQLDSVKLNVTGTQAAHQFDSQVAGRVLIKAGVPARTVKGVLFPASPAVQWVLKSDASGNGRLTDEAWSGQIARLSNQGQPNINMQRPIQVAWEKGELKLSNIVGQVQDAQLNIETLNVLGSRINSRGRVNHLVIPQWLTWLNVSLPANLSTDMAIKGQWDVTMGNAPSGGFSFEREQGDVWLDRRQKNSLGLSAMNIRGVLNGRNMNVTGLMQSDRLGQLNIDGKVGMIDSSAGWVLSSISPLDLSAKADFKKLDQLNATLGTNIKLGGQIQADIQLAGVLGGPTMSGVLTGQNIDFLHVEQGFRLKDGVIRLKLADSSVDFEQFDFNGTEGKLSVRGQVTYGSSGRLLTAQVSMDKLRPFVRLDRQLVLSGKAELGYDGISQLLIKGNVRADKALIDLPPTLAPNLDEDVVVCSSDPAQSRRCDASPETVKPERFGLVPSVDLTLDLGNDFRFKGQGADVNLVGSMRLQSNQGSPLTAKGVVRVASGTYKFYGQRLNVDRGIVTFQGPLDDPALNMFATRSVNTVEVGVELTGTLADSKARLISTPEMPDEEKLSYLLFGRSSSTLSTTDGSAIAGAAAVLLGTDQGRKVTEKLGIDSFNLGSSDNGLTGTVVGVGKRLNDRFSVAYEQTLDNVIGVVKVTWSLSRNWQLMLRGGSINGVDIEYSKRFDRLH